MGKQGPCYHCGVTSTPLWRNGPPEKPVLCNACGSRWRTKGTLANYTPLHARVEPAEFKDSKAKTISIKNKETKVLKWSFDSDAVERVVYADYNQRFHKGFDEDTSNRSSSGSAISNSESCAQYGNADASDLTGPYQLSVWDSTVPSRKRTCVTRPKPSPVEKLTKDLYTIWHEQQSSGLSGSSEEDLLLECDKPMVSVEIGHGSVLIRHPSSIAPEEESEASSLSIDNKQHTVSSQHTTFPDFIEDIAASSNKGIEKIKKPANHRAEHEQITSFSEKDQLEKLQILAHHYSPLCYIDLQDVINFETFSSHLTTDEQQQLLNLLPCIDASEAPYRKNYSNSDSAQLGMVENISKANTRLYAYSGPVSLSSLKTMFDSAPFNENLLSFQKLLADGAFNNSLCGVNTEDYRSLKELILHDLPKSKCVGKYTVLKDLKCENRVDSEVVGGFNALENVRSEIMKRSRDGQPQEFEGSKIIQKRPRIIMKSSYDEKDDSFLSPKSLFSLQDDDASLVLDSDQDLLLDVPSNGSFPEAELLPTSSFGALACMSSSSSSSSSSMYLKVVLP